MSEHLRWYAACTRLSPLFGAGRYLISRKGFQSCVLLLLLRLLLRLVLRALLRLRCVPRRTVAAVPLTPARTRAAPLEAAVQLRPRPQAWDAAPAASMCRAAARAALAKRSTPVCSAAFLRLAQATKTPWADAQGVFFAG